MMSMLLSKKFKRKFEPFSKLIKALYKQPESSLCSVNSFFVFFIFYRQLHLVTENSKRNMPKVKENVIVNFLYNSTIFTLTL